MGARSLERDVVVVVVVVFEEGVVVFEEGVAEEEGGADDAGTTGGAEGDETGTTGTDLPFLDGVDVGVGVRGGGVGARRERLVERF